MQRLSDLNFVRAKLPVTPVVGALVAGVLAAGVWIGMDAVRVGHLGDEVASLQQRVDGLRQTAEKARRADKQGGPDQRKVDAVVSAQMAAKASGGVPMLTKIGQAWVPQLGLLSLNVQRVGQEAKITGETTDLTQVYAFVDRLQAKGSGLRAMLLRHGVKTDSAQQVIVFDISVEQR